MSRIPLYLSSKPSSKIVTLVICIKLSWSKYLADTVETAGFQSWNCVENIWISRFCLISLYRNWICVWFESRNNSNLAVSTVFSLVWMSWVAHVFLYSCYSVQLYFCDALITHVYFEISTICVYIYIYFYVYCLIFQPDNQLMSIPNFMIIGINILRLILNWVLIILLYLNK